MSRWSVEKASEWYARRPWLVGCDFTPSTAINQLEMWQADTFDVPTIERELSWAADFGMNCLRVYLHDLAWEADAAGFKERIDRFLGIASSRGIRAALVFFDDCWNANPQIGPQPAPIPGVHNSGWLQSPGPAVVNDPTAWGRLARYVEDIVGAFAQDDRVLLWDMYNEAGNTKQEERSLPLLCKAFEWARSAAPCQPLTAGVWTSMDVLNAFLTAASDVITFHNYESADKLSAQIAGLRRLGRPLICTEWLRRGHSDVATCLPVFHREKVGCLNWGLVSGRTQTIFPWGSPKGAPEPALWQHDLLRRDGTPFDPKEVDLFRQLTGVKKQFLGGSR